MRADRLVAILLMLQTRGRITAADVAEELEVSERTARRDLDALAASGVPLYSRQGRGGGWELLGGGRTDLSGLTAPEARALFLLAGPSTSATPEVRAALRKLLRALPEPLRLDADRAATAVLVDQARWGAAGRSAPPPRWLDRLQHAVIDGAELDLAYRSGHGEDTRRLVRPLGVVNKRHHWYLLADTEHGRRTFRLDRIADATPTGSRHPRPDGFDLAAAWDEVDRHVAERFPTMAANGWLDPSMLEVTRRVLGPRLSIGPAGDDGRIEVEVRGGSTRSLAAEVAPFATWLEITSPDEVRDELARIGTALVERYGPA